MPGYVQHSEVFKRIPKYVVRIAQAGNAIIVGRGGAIITQKLDNCYHFRLEADLDFRVATIARRMEIPEPDARRLVKENEKARDKFIEDCLRVSASDTTIYDAVFNNARHGVAEIAQSIVAYVDEAWKKRSEASQPASR